MIGQKPCGACCMKYATAISPHVRNAARLATSPIAISRPPQNSMIPAVNISGTWVTRCPPSTPNNFCAPWHAKRKPITVWRQRKSALQVFPKSSSSFPPFVMFAVGSSPPVRTVGRCAAILPDARKIKRNNFGRSQPLRPLLAVASFMEPLGQQPTGLTDNNEKNNLVL